MTAVSADLLPRAYAMRMPGHRAKEMLNTDMQVPAVCQLAHSYWKGHHSDPAAREGRVEDLGTLTGSKTQILKKEI